MPIGMTSSIDLFQVTGLTIEKTQGKDLEGKPYWIKRITVHQGDNQHVDITLFAEALI
jgi:hypothetical protein